MRIEIHYQRCSDTAPQVTTLTPELYFDPLEHGVTYEESGIPKYNHAVDYLPFAADELKWTELLVVESGSGYTIRTEFYGSGALMWHRKDSDGYEEICLETKISVTEWHLERMHKVLPQF